MNNRFFTALIYAMSFCIQYSAYSIETIQITKGVIEPIPSAINTFETHTTEEDSISRLLVEVVRNDLANSGLFKIVPEGAFIETKIGISHKPVFASWKQINAVILLNGQIMKTGNNKFKAKVILWDTVSGKEIFGNVFEATIDDWRRVAHKIADKVYERVMGEKGYFDTKIVYVSESTSGKKKLKQIAIMDYDGANHKYITDQKTIVLTPRLSPKTDKVLFLSYIKGIPRVYIKDIKTGRESLVGNFPGMSFAPRFAPNGQKAIMSISNEGYTNIFEIDLRTNKLKQLTHGFAISTSPSYSPDGSKVYFNSDMSGTKQLYVMDSDGSNVQRISFGTGNYFTPVCSPKGDYIAFTKILDSGFTIGIMRQDGTGERLLTEPAYIAESPTWSPNGRKIVYTKERNIGGGKSITQIYEVDTTGFFERQVRTPKEASDPEWSNSLE